MMIMHTLILAAISYIENGKMAIVSLFIYLFSDVHAEL